jgi:alpha-beta hydrolase superfamily lysophospholipase
MRGILLGLTATIGLAIGATASELPRRGTLGVALQPVQGGPGVKIVTVMNPASGLQPEDIVLGVVGGKPINAPGGLPLPVQLYGKKGGEKITLNVLRGGATQQIAATLIPAPPPLLDGRPIELGEAQAPGGPRVRTFLLEPQDKKLARNGRLPAVMILPGIPCGTQETFAAGNQAYSKYFRMFTAAGVTVVMAEKPGQGDSEGVICEEGGFDAEEQAFRAAAKKFTADKRIDPKRFFILGLSLGAFQAPLVAESAPAAGIITWGGGVSPWSSYTLTTFHRRDIISGEDPIQSRAQFDAWRKVLAALIYDGKPLEQVQREMPAQYSAVEQWAGGDLAHFAGRAWVFHREIDKAPIVRAWNAYKGKLLSLHGEFDWVSEKHDHELAATIVNRNRPGDALFEIVPGNDHGATKHKTIAESFAKPFQGEPDDSYFNRAVAWVVEVAGK